MSEHVLETRTAQPAELVGPDFMNGGGEMGALMRAHDWSSSSVGPPSNWSQSLRTVVRLMLNTGHPMYIFWGADGACLYNDAYRRSIGPERHPGSLGRPAPEAWREALVIIGPPIEQEMSVVGERRGTRIIWSPSRVTAVAKMSIGPTAIAQSTTIPPRGELAAFS